MKFASFVLQICSFFVLIGGVLGTFATLSAPSYSAFGNNWLALISGTVISWATLYGIGGAFAFIEDMAVDARLTREASERTAKSIELLVYRQRPQQQQTPSSNEQFNFPEASQTGKRSDEPPKRAALKSLGK